MTSWPHYSWLQAAIKSLFIVLALLACLSSNAAELLIDAGPGQIGSVRWERLEVQYRAGDDGDWRAVINGVHQADGMALGDLWLRCERDAETAPPECARGFLNWRRDEQDLLEAEFSVLRRAANWHIEARADGWELELTLPEGQPAALEAMLRFRDFQLSSLPETLLAAAGLSVLDGRLGGQVQRGPEGNIAVGLRLDETGFDTKDGLFAAEGLELELQFSVFDLPEGLSIDGQLRQDGGEILAGPLYLPAPAKPLLLEFSGQQAGTDRWRISRIRLEDPGALVLDGQAMIEASDGEWGLAALDFGTVQASMPAFWQRWADGLAAQAGFGDLQTRGELGGRLTWDRASGWSAHALIEDFDLEDPAERLAVVNLSGNLVWQDDGPGTDLAWDGLALYGLPFGPSALRLAAGESGVELMAPLELPLLDGAIVIDRLFWQPAEVGEEGLRLDARIRPLSLARLTHQLSWPEFGGVLSGEFPGIVYANEQLSFTGGIVMQAFSGTIELADLSIERPFGTLPAVSAQLQMTRLDLLELTGAFNFGRMEGQVSGWMRDLRLLDWRPVRMDARLFTHEDVPRRRISQRAVDNLSSLGGAGGALISGTVLRVFEDFPYRRAGLACRLANNICHIDGVAPHESGGFYIVEGRALPRLDIIGHRRLVDWPQLVRQLEAMVD